MSGLRCDIGRPGGRVCGAVLIDRVDAIGRVHWSCPKCTRRKAGVCIDCPRPIVGRPGIAERCARCRARALRRDNRTWRSRDVRHYRTLTAQRAKDRRDLARGHPPLTPHEVGLRGGAGRAAALSPARRSEIARLAVTARWARVRAAQAVAA